MNDATPATTIEPIAPGDVEESDRNAMLHSVALGVGAAGAVALLMNGPPALGY